MVEHEQTGAINHLTRHEGHGIKNKTVVDHERTGVTNHRYRHEVDCERTGVINHRFRHEGHTNPIRQAAVVITANHLPTP